MNQISVSPQLLLIGKRELRSNNSWLHNYHRLVKGKKHCLLHMHPSDLKDHGFKDEQTIIVKSRVGEMKVSVTLSNEIMRGVVCLPHGWGHGRDGVKMSIAAQNQGVNINDLTDDHFIDALSGVAALNGVPVTVHPVDYDPE